MSTKGEPVDEVTDVPETPKWTKFFDGPLFQKYQEFMKSHDFSKILINGSVLNQNNLTVPDYDGPDLQPDDRKNSDRNTSDTKESEKEKMGDSRLNSDSDHFLRSPDFQKRQRRTRGLIVLGVMVIAAVALATGLVIHYLVIPKDSNIKKQYNISLASNMSGTYIDGTTTTTRTETVRKEESDKSDVLKSAAKASRTIQELESTMQNVFTIVKNKQLGIAKSSTPATTSMKPLIIPKTSRKAKRIRVSTTATTIIKETRQMSTAITTNEAKTPKTVREITTKLMPRTETNTTEEKTSSVATTTASTTTTAPTKATTTQTKTTTTTTKATTTQITTTLPDKYSMKPMP